MAKEVTLDVRRSPHNDDGWCVSLNGTNVVVFLGPDARNRAEHQRDELATHLAQAARLMDRRRRLGFCGSDWHQSQTRQARQRLETRRARRHQSPGVDHRGDDGLADASRFERDQGPALMSNRDSFT